MVLSQLHPAVQYKEQKELYDDDIDMESKLYDIFFPTMRLRLNIAVGKPRHTATKNGILFFPLYLIHDEKFVMQIGIYEINVNELQEIKDEDDEIDIELIKRDPLLYNFSTQDNLKQYGEYVDDINEGNNESIEEDKEESAEDDDNKNNTKSKDDNDEDEMSDDEIVEEKEEVADTDTGKKRDYMSVLGRKKYMSIFTDKIDYKGDTLLPEETGDDASSEKKVFKEKMTSTWIEKFMKNNNYSISRTNPDGNCFFQVIRDAFDSIGKKTTIEKIRTIFSDSIDEKTYLMYKEKYDMFKESYDNDSKEMKQVKEEISQGKKKYKMTKDRKAQESLETFIEERISILKNLNDGIETTKELLNEFEYMKNINSLEEFKEFILTPKCWADTLTVSRIEQLMNIKIIILSQEAYDNNDKDNVITCGQLNDTILEDAGKFEPSYYIITQFSGDHYDLIGYKSKLVFQFREIPYDLKKLILMKCLEQKSGPYNIIPEFKEMKSMYDSKITVEETKYLTDTPLYDENIVFQVYHNSSDKPFPGKGAGENIHPDDPDTRKKYAELSKIINWRRKLANTHVQPFLLKGKNWNSVEHYIQAQKFKNNPDVHDQFTIESKSSISEDPLKAKEAGTKKTYFKDRYVIDTNFSSKLSEYLTEALEAKFSNEELKTLLLSTKDAKIVSFARANAPPVMTELMEVRKSMS
jgi:predicted NAD-dependent protein-ADP-ribosyltransferase YbiA (DUF1768 family)